MTTPAPSELDRWFPRPTQPEPQPEPQPDPGVIEGVRRPQQKRYGRRWYQTIKKENDNANPNP